MQHETEKWELPPQLRISNPDVLARADAMQAELAIRVNSPFGQMSPQEQQRANAAILADDLKRRLTYVDKQITDIEMVDGNDSQSQKMEELQAARIAISAQLAEAYATLGRFDLAASIDPRPESRAEHVEILEAINRDDGDTCDCAPGKTFVVRDVFSLRHGQMMPAVKCSGCGLVNVTALPPELSEQRGHRARARALVEGKSPEEAKAALTAAGHTNEKLIKK